MGSFETELERRIAAALRRIGDASVTARVAARLTGADAVALFELLLDADDRVVVAAHECVTLRFGRVVAAVARTFSFDEYQRDDLVQRTFVDLPAVVRRVANRGDVIIAPEAWLRRRAQFTARQMLREEPGDVPLDASHDTPDDARVFDMLDRADERELLHAALDELERERPVWAAVLRMHYLEGQSLDAVARALGRTHGTIRNDAQKARARLEAIIRDRHEALVPDAKRGKKNARP